VAEAVTIPFVTQFLDEQGRIQANQVMETAAVAMLDELRRWVAALAPLRGRPAP
jgi:hypothetical protein